MKKPTLGLSMIVRDEEKVIGRCLDSFGDLFDEIVIVDTGSVDKTKEIVSKYTDKIYDFEWIYDFAAARNYSFSKNTCDFIMWLDADDIVDEDNLNKLKELKNELDLSVDAYRLWYSCVEDKEGHSIVKNTRARILRNIHKDRWIGKIHETMPIGPNAPLKNILIRHRKEHVNDPDRNLQIYQKMEENNDYFDIRDLALYSTELMCHNKYDDALRIIDKIFKRKVDKNAKFYYDKSIVNKYRIYCSLNKPKKEKKKILTSYLNTFMPTPILCCEMGNMFFEDMDLPIAKYWYDTALYVAREYPEDETDYNGFIELYQLGAVYFYMGDYQKAVECTTEALRIHPDNENLQRNLNDFTAKLKEVHEAQKKDK